MIDKTPLPSISKAKLLQKLNNRLYFVRKESANSRQWFLCKQNKTKSFYPQYSVTDEVIKELFSQGILEENEISAPLSSAGRMLIRRIMLNGGEILGQHQDRQQETLLKDGVEKHVVIDHHESPLTWLHKRKNKNGHPLIDKHQFASGERLRASYEKALMPSQITQNWDRLASSLSKHNKNNLKELTLSEAALSAKQNYMKALDAVGPELSGILIDICCEQRGLEDAEKRNGWPKRSGKVILGIALTRLARHYGFISTPKAIFKKSGPIHHWGEEGYRPTIDGQ